MVQIEGNKNFTVVTAAVVANRLVKNSGASILYNTALASDKPIGVTQGDGAVGDPVAVKLLHNDGTVQIEAAGAITAGAAVYAAASGKVQAAPDGAASFRKVGIALEAASASGSIIEVLLIGEDINTKDMTVGSGGVVANALVKLSSGTIVLNTVTSTDDPIGTVPSDADADDTAPVKMLGDGQPRDMIAAGAITEGADVYAAADGEVSALSSVNGTYRKIGIALEAATTDQDIISVLPYDFHATETVSG